jgi:hypothetical protein
VIYEPGELWWNYIDKGKLMISPTELTGIPVSSHIMANQEELGEGNDEFSLRNIFVRTSK